MAIQKRQGKTGVSWRVYWNNPYTGARQSCSFASQAEAVKHDALVKYQLQYEKERFMPVEPQREKKPDDSLESTFYAFLKERQFSRKGLAFPLDGMKRALVLIGRKSISAITKQDLATVVQAEVSKGVSAKTVHTRTGSFLFLAAARTRIKLRSKSTSSQRSLSSSHGPTRNPNLEPMIITR